MTSIPPGAGEPSGSTSPATGSEPSSVYEPPLRPGPGDPMGPSEPAAAPAPPGAALPAGRSGTEHVWATLSTVRRRGAWQVPERLLVTAVLGETRIDLREATLTSTVTTIEVRGVLGEVRVIVPDGLRVECAGSAVLGEFEQRESAPSRSAPADAPLVRVVGAAVLGEVRVYRTGAAVGEGRLAVDGLTGVRARLRRRKRRAG